jgi:hypothetical protein
MKGVLFPFPKGKETEIGFWWEGQKCFLVIGMVF